MQAQYLNFSSYIYILDYQFITTLTLDLNLLGFLIFRIKLHLTEVLEQPGIGIQEFKIMEISDRCHANVYKLRMLKVDVHIAPP